MIGTTTQKRLSSEELRDSIQQQFKPVTLFTIIDYIQKHRDYSIYQDYTSTDETPHLSHLKKNPVFRVCFYKGDEATQSVIEKDVVTIDQFECTFLSSSSF